MMSIAISYGRSDVVAVPIVIAVVLVVVVVIVVDGLWTVMVMVISRAVRIPSVVVRVVPSPTIVEAAVIPVGVIIVRAVVVVRPPPIIAQVDADTPAGGTVVIPIHVGEIGVVVAPTRVNIGVESADARAIAVIIVVVRIIDIAGGCSCRDGCGGITFNYLHVGGDHRLAAARIIGQRAEQISVLIGFINDGISFHRRSLCR